jgi:hypothetical protein
VEILTAYNKGHDDDDDDDDDNNDDDGGGDGGGGGAGGQRVVCNVSLVRRVLVHKTCVNRGILAEEGWFILWDVSMEFKLT